MKASNKDRWRKYQHRYKYKIVALDAETHGALRRCRVRPETMNDVVRRLLKMEPKRKNRRQGSGPVPEGKKQGVT